MSSHLYRVTLTGVSKPLNERFYGGLLPTALRHSHELLDHTFEIWIAGAKAPCEPVPTALGNPLAVSDHLELTGPTRRNDGFNVEVLFDEGHETRDLGLVVLSRRAVNDLDLHLFSNLLRVATSVGSSSYGAAN
jgi:hypothetical protein